MSVSSGRILVMDDEISILHMVGEILRFYGYEVDVASSGEEVLAMYTKRKYDAVILDLIIPGKMGGIEAMEALLKTDPDVKAILTSGFSRDPVMSNFRSHGFIDAIAKPYTFEELGKTVQRVLTS